MTTEPKAYPLFKHENIHTHLPGHGGVLSIDFTNPDRDRLIGLGQPFTLGVHPWYADRQVDWDVFASYLNHPDIVGVGEAGLDSLKGPDPDKQNEVFLKQIELAEQFSLPLVIHSVRNHHRVLQLHKQLRPSVPWIIHGFRGNVVLAKQLTDAGIHLSLGKHFDPTVIDAVPGHMLHRETDDERQ